MYVSAIYYHFAVRAVISTESVVVAIFFIVPGFHCCCSCSYYGSIVASLLSASSSGISMIIIVVIRLLCWCCCPYYFSLSSLISILTAYFVRVGVVNMKYINSFEPIFLWRSVSSSSSSSLSSPTGLSLNKHTADSPCED